MNRIALRHNPHKPHPSLIPRSRQTNRSIDLLDEDDHLAGGGSNCQDSPELAAMEALAEDLTPGAPGEKRTGPGAAQVVGGVEAWKADARPLEDSEILGSLAAERGRNEAEGAARFSGTSAPSLPARRDPAVTIRTSRILLHLYPPKRQIGTKI
jgi:hypothetical protein